MLPYTKDRGEVLCQVVLEINKMEQETRVVQTSCGFIAKLGGRVGGEWTSAWFASVSSCCFQEHCWVEALYVTEKGQVFVLCENQVFVFKIDLHELSAFRVCRVGLFFKGLKLAAFDCDSETNSRQLVLLDGENRCLFTAHLE